MIFRKIFEECTCNNAIKPFNVPTPKLSNQKSKLHVLEEANNVAHYSPVNRLRISSRGCIDLPSAPCSNNHAKYTLGNVLTAFSAAIFAVHFSSGWYQLLARRKACLFHWISFNLTRTFYNRLLHACPRKSISRRSSLLLRGCEATSPRVCVPVYRVWNRVENVRDDPRSSRPRYRNFPPVRADWRIFYDRSIIEEWEGVYAQRAGRKVEGEPSPAYCQVSEKSSKNLHQGTRLTWLGSYAPVY